MDFKAQKVTFKTYFSSFLIWTAIILGIVIIISELILSMITYKSPFLGIPNSHNLWTPNGIWAGIWESLSTFSMQTIILIVIFFCLVLTNRIYPHRAKFVNGPFGLAITLYATITVIVFWTVLFKSDIKDIKSKNIAELTKFGYTFFLHLALPLTIIIYYLVNAGSTKWNLKRTAIITLPLTLAYMLVYLAYALLKGTYVGVVVTSTNNVSSIDYSYPYPFLNFKANVGNFLIYFFAILVAFLLLYAFYFFYNNWRNNQISKQANNLK